jgi:glucans biosynthesis protein
MSLMNSKTRKITYVSRRQVLSGAGGLVSVALLARQAWAEGASGLIVGTGFPFSYEWLKERARTLAKGPYVPPPRPAPEIVQQIDYEAHGAIRFKPDYALFANGPGRFPVTFFHLGQNFPKTVRMHVVIAGEAKEIIYRPEYFDMPADSPARQLPENAGFAGFRFQESRFGHPGRRGETLDWRKNDWVAFLGASYFRAIGSDYQYGISARGLAVDPAVAGVAEEFPDFTNFYIETPADGSNEVTVYALLEGPSVTGAFRFRMRRDRAVTMDIEKEIHLRRDIQRLCIAPLTSMYWYSETAKPAAIDWRPEIHDSDGLAMWTGAGERIWRPLNNPPRTVTSAFSDENVRGFGLMQRDRVTDHYLDGVAYERRPSLWVEPLGDWGKGTVQLIEIPTDDEIHDNIVAAWVPAEPAKAGQSLSYRYRLYWQAEEPNPSPLARAVALRIGRGGEPGKPRPEGRRKFVVEFLGEPLAKLPNGTLPEAVVTVSRGETSHVFTEAVPNDVPGHWRAQFDLAAEGSEPVEIRLYLRLDGHALSETVLYQYHPF